MQTEQNYTRTLMSEEKSIGIYLTSMTMGGAERVALNLCTGLVDNGYDVDLVLVEATGKLLNDVPTSVSVISLEANRVAKSLLPLRKYLSSEEPDVLYSMMTEPNVLALIAKQLAPIRSRLVISEHNMLSNSSGRIKDQFVKKCAWGLYPLADKVVAVSEGVKNDLIENTRLERNEVTKIYNSVAVDFIRKQAAEQVDDDWLIDDSLDVVLAGGRHEPQKRFDTLLDAFARLNQNNRRLILFGSGPETEPLKSQAESLGIEDRVCFLGFVENPFKYMKAADVFVLSSEYEGFGLVLIEALACGCPVVSTDCESGPAEILEAGTYGRLVPVGDEDALADAITATLNSPINSTLLQNRANDFGIEPSIARYDSLFRSLCK